MNTLDSIASFAASCNYRHSPYKRSEFVKNLTDAVTCCEKLKGLSESDKAVLKVSIDILTAHAKKKYSAFLAPLFLNRKELASCINRLERLSEKLDKVAIKGERAFRIQFLAALPKTLRIKDAPDTNFLSRFTWRSGHKDEKRVNEQSVVGWLSNAVYHSSQVNGDWNRYVAVMTGAYKGDHLLIEDDASYKKVQELAAHGAILRGSSHYEKGRTIKEWKDGLPIFEAEGRDTFIKAEMPHHGITGKHVRHILFNGVEMYHTQEGKIIPGKTANQVQHLLDANKQVTDIDGNKVGEGRLKTRHYIALQFESSADSDGNNLFDPKFYTHRIAGFITYRLRKLFGIEKANIGAYGYGVTDVKPVILDIPDKE